MIIIKNNLKKTKLNFSNKKKTNQNFKIIILVFIIGLLMISFIKLNFLNEKIYRLSSFTYYKISYPIFLIQNKYLKLKNYLLFIYNKNNFYISRQKLQKQIQNLKTLKSENNNLKKLVNFKDNFIYSKITSRVVIELFHGFEKRYLVNIGSINGIKKGNAVISNDRLIGKIVGISLKSSKMQLLIDKNSKISVFVLGCKHKGIANGQNNERNLKLNFYLKDIKLEDNKIVITSGENNYIPYGIYIGTTKKIKDEIFIDISSNNNKAIGLISILRLKENFINS